jgi:hypothetical protein
MEAKIRYTLYAVMLSLGTGLFYTLLERLAGGQPWFVNLVLGLLLTVLLGPAAGFLLDLRSELRQRTDHLERRLDQQIQDLTSSVQANIGVTRDLMRSLHLKKSLADLSGLKQIRELAEETLDEHLEGFSTEPGGLVVRGEVLSLRVYKQFWVRLVELQKQQREKYGDSDEHRLIARVTHSNDIRIWDPDHSDSARRLLSLQRAFVDAGGRIVRLLVHKDFGGNGDLRKQYEKVQKLMEEHRIEARLLHHPHDYGFDLIWVDPVGLVVKWYSGASGQRVEKCEVLEYVGRDVREQWESLGVATEALNGRIKNIPASRQFEIGYLRPGQEAEGQDGGQGASQQGDGASDGTGAHAVGAGQRSEDPD